MNSSHIGRVAFLLVLVAAIGGFSGHANGAVLTFQDNYEFSGGTAPAGVPPWLTTTISDVSPGTVTLTFTATGLTGNEQVGGLYLNLDPSLDPTSLQFGFLSKVGTFIDPGINLSLNVYQPDGGGFFDILIAFTTDPNADLFGPGDSISYTVSGIPTLNALSFDFPSVAGEAQPARGTTPSKWWASGPGQFSHRVRHPSPGPGTCHPVSSGSGRTGTGFAAKAERVRPKPLINLHGRTFSRKGPPLHLQVQEPHLSGVPRRI